MLFSCIHVFYRLIIIEGNKSGMILRLELIVCAKLKVKVSAIFCNKCVYFHLKYCFNKTVV